MNDYMDGLLKLIGGIVSAIVILSYMLACAFAPFGIVWLVLTH
jgi:F0F1-type ATP synthase assembly protein I